MKTLADADAKYGDLVRKAGAKIVGFNDSYKSLSGRVGEAIRIGTPDEFVTTHVHLDQPDIEKVLAASAAGVVQRAAEVRADSTRLMPSSPPPKAAPG